MKMLRIIFNRTYTIDELSINMEDDIKENIELHMLDNRDGYVILPLKYMQYAFKIVKNNYGIMCLDTVTKNNLVFKILILKDSIKSLPICNISIDKETLDFSYLLKIKLLPRSICLTDIVQYQDQYVLSLSSI